MNDIIEDINDLIINPKDECDESGGIFIFLSYLFGALGWLLVRCFVYPYPIWLAVICWGVSVCCGIVWYNISDDYDTRSKISHYAYAILSVLLNGSWLIALPVLLVFTVITMPLWIGSYIKR